jgi:hypothetical protein
VHACAAAFGRTLNEFTPDDTLYSDELCYWGNRATRCNSVRSAADQQSNDVHAFEHNRAANKYHHQRGRTDPANTIDSVHASDAKRAFDSADAAGSIDSAERNNADHACAGSGNATGRHDTYECARIDNYSSSLCDHHCPEWVRLNQPGIAFWIDHHK